MSPVGVYVNCVWYVLCCIPTVLIIFYSFVKCVLLLYVCCVSMIIFSFFLSIIILRPSSCDIMTIHENVDTIMV